MQFENPLIAGTLVKRYKRFLADVELADGSLVTTHTPNTGSMKGCCTPGSQVWLRKHENPKRKYPLSWEMVEVSPGTIVGINTTLANDLVMEAIQEGLIPEFNGYRSIRREVRYGRENSRIDLLLEDHAGTQCFIEVKNVTLVEHQIAYFPDAVSKRGSRHLRELAYMVNAGNRGVIIYCVQRRDANEVRPAAKIDPEYAQTLREVVNLGVEALAYEAEVTPLSIKISNPLPVGFN